MRKELTAKGKATRNRIVEGAAVVLREKGVSAATLDDVMARTRTSKSQLFHYFPAGKDELLLAVAQYEADQVLEDQQPYLGCLDSWDAWQQWRDVVVDRYEEQGDQCPLGSLFLHLGRSTPGARAVVIELMHRWQASLATGIRALQSAGHLPADLDVEHRAAALLAGIQGGCRFSSRPAGPTTSGPRSTRGSGICAALRPEARPARRGSIKRPGPWGASAQRDHEWTCKSIFFFA